jgi:hypothetical protein
MLHVTPEYRDSCRKDVYVVHADSDVHETLAPCLRRAGVRRVLLALEEDEPGSVKAQNIVTHLDHSWKVRRRTSSHISTTAGR